MKAGIEIGNYVLAERLDQGGTGEVWLAYRELAAGGRTAVAVKFPHAAGVLDPRVRDGLDDEARLQMQLQHSNIPRVIDLGLHEGQPYFVMDYIAGCSLAELLVSLRVFGTELRFEVIAHIAREIGYALRYAHGFQLDGVSRPVLHRYVAPENVLLSGEGAVYVVDFGISEAAGIHVSGTPARSRLLYMAPEHALGFPTPKSDGWGLGAILWEMIEGRPFRAEVDADDLPRAAKQGRHDRLTREGIPEVLQLVTEGLLCADDGERLTLDEALRQLEAPELPVQRMALADVLKDCFGDAFRRPVRSRPDVEAPAHADQPLAAAKVIRDEGPFGLNAWSEEPEDVALPPPPAWASMDDAVAAGAEPSSVLDLGESSSAEVPRPEQPPAREREAAPPAAAPRSRSSAVVMPVLALALAGLAWVAWPRGTPEARPEPAPAVPAAPDPQPPVGPPNLEPAPTVVPEPPPTVVEPEPTVDTAPTVAPVVPEPAPTVEPSSEPKPPPSTKPKAVDKPPPKKSGPPAQLAITLRLFADMELELDGQHFSLGVRRTAAKASVAPGKVRARWRRPLGKWKSKTFEVDAGGRYEVLLDDRGVTFKKK